MRTIVHLDMDAFYASVELLRRPELRGKPMVVSHRGRRSVITTASYEARKQYGIGSAMPLSTALRLCPDLEVVQPDFPTYKLFSTKVMNILRQHVELVEVMGLDEAYLDLTDYVAPSAAMARIRTQIKSETGLTCSIGRGPNRLLAKIASGLEKPEGSVTLTQDQALARFAASSPGLIPGIGPKTLDRLKQLGIATLEQLRQAPLELLRQHFGETTGPRLAQRSRFNDDSPVVELREIKSQSSETTFEYDCFDIEQLATKLGEMAVELNGKLQRRGLCYRTVAIKVRLNDWTTVTRAQTLDRYVNDAEVMKTTAIDLLREYNPLKPVRLLGVRASTFEAVDSGLTESVEVGQIQLQV